MEIRVKVLSPAKSQELDSCAICRISCVENGRHAVYLPVSLRDCFVCDDCAQDYGIVCECCEAGISILDIAN